MKDRIEIRTRSAFAGRWLIGAAPLTLGGLLWFAHTRSAAPPPAPVTLASGNSNAPVPAPVLRSTLALASIPSALVPAGSERSYRASYKTNVDAENGAHLASFALAGELKFAGLDANDGHVIGGEFHGKLRVNGAADAGGEAGRALEVAVERPFLLVFSADGRFREVRGAADAPAFVGRMWQAIGEYLQIVRQPGESWQVAEVDASGTYLADYKLGDGVLIKQKAGYQSLSSQHIKSYDVREYEGRFRFDVPAALESFTLKEGLAAVAVDGPFATFDSNTELELVASGPLQPLGGTAWASLLATASALKTSGGQDASSYDKARVGGFGFGEAYARLGDLDAKDKETRERAERAFVALAALLRQDPKTLALVAAKLTKDGPVTEPLLAALRDASTPESQALLAKMAAPTSPLSADNRLEAARSLSRVPTPTADTVDALKSLRSDPTVGTQATYGLGSALHRLENQDPELADATRQTLATQLDQAQTPAQQAAVLTALGNAGSSALLQSVRKYVTDPSPAVRAAAAQALRRIPGPDADDMLASLTRDPVADVRWAAVDAIRERSPSPVLDRALSERALGEDQFAIRSRSINALSAWLPEDAAIADTLRVVAERDPSQDLRNVARNALASQGT